MRYAHIAGWMAGAAVVMAVGVMGGRALSAWGPPQRHGPASNAAHEARIQATERRLAEIERRQREILVQLKREAVGSSGYPYPTSTSERTAMLEQRKEKSRRIREDPAYALQVQKEKLARLQAEFASETIDHRWAADSHSLVADALSSATSKAGASLNRDQIDCRSNTCRIILDLPTKYSYEDVTTYLMTDLAELLPTARFAVMPPQEGVRTVNIFASRDSDALPERLD